MSTVDFKNVGKLVAQLKKVNWFK